MEDMDLVYSFSAFVAEVAYLRDHYQCYADEMFSRSSNCHAYNDTAGMYAHYAMGVAYESVVGDLSALLDKAESGR